MAKRARWIHEDEIDGETLIESSKYVSHARCAFKDCTTLLFYNAPGGDDDDAEFRVESCTCDWPTLCCSKHVDDFVCLDCNKEDEEEENKNE